QPQAWLSLRPTLPTGDGDLRASYTRGDRNTARPPRTLLRREPDPWCRPGPVARLRHTPPRYERRPNRTSPGTSPVTLHRSAPPRQRQCTLPCAHAPIRPTRRVSAESDGISPRR